VKTLITREGNKRKMTQVTGTEARLLVGRRKSDVQKSYENDCLFVKNYYLWQVGSTIAASEKK
jgi:hypothetical protein